ncbi:hypothetical protein DL769_008931 [Monosporascus sp. CRB-8-3]|nr:hypothetical protein DL769_008931 [Monosporascus sp. CRB-8-3]
MGAKTQRADSHSNHDARKKMSRKKTPNGETASQNSREPMPGPAILDNDLAEIAHLAIQCVGWNLFLSEPSEQPKAFAVPVHPEHLPLHRRILFYFIHPRALTITCLGFTFALFAHIGTYKDKGDWTGFYQAHWWRGLAIAWIVSALGTRCEAAWIWYLDSKEKSPPQPPTQPRDVAHG